MTKVTAILTHHDSWSGPEETIRIFHRRCDASRYVNKVNGANTLDHVPECYTTARIKDDDYRAQWPLRA